MAIRNRGDELEQVQIKQCQVDMLVFKHYDNS